MREYAGAQIRRVQGEHEPNSAVWGGCVLMRFPMCVCACMLDAFAMLCVFIDSLWIRMEIFNNAPASVQTSAEEGAGAAWCAVITSLTTLFDVDAAEYSCACARDTRVHVFT